MAQPPTGLPGDYLAGRPCAGISRADTPIYYTVIRLSAQPDISVAVVGSSVKPNYEIEMPLKFPVEHDTIGT
jgi:hypothetical protein